MRYFLRQNPYNHDSPVIVRDGDFANIPADESNMSYQAYLAWLAEGNTPEPWEAD